MWSVYLISTGSRTYIGSTTDIRRRLRQHNSEIRGGARSTRHWPGQWRIIAHISGFPDRSSACRWERIIKCRARGLEKRLAAFKQVASGVCPPGRNKPQYPVPEGIHLITQEYTDGK